MNLRPFRWPVGPAADGRKEIPGLKPLPPKPKPAP